MRPTNDPRGVGAGRTARRVIDFKSPTLGYTSIDINVLGSLPGSTGVFRLDANNRGQSVESYVDSTGRDYHEQT